MEKNFATLGDLIIIKTLGVGQTGKVKLALNPHTNEQYAVKILKSPYELSRTIELEREICALSKLKHPNIVNLKQVFETVEYVKKSGKKYTATALVFDFVRGGDLYEMIKGTGGFSEKIARAHFRTLIETVEFCHNQGITHRDIKPENLLFDENFVLKVADFGYAALVAGPENNRALMTSIGSDPYMAPELRAKKTYSGAAVDVFACGVVLFIMINSAPPFDKADEKDSYYRHIASGNNDNFWTMSKRHLNGQPSFDPEFKDLINGMLAVDPAIRLTIPEIKAHKWYNMEIENQENIKRDFEIRKAFIDKALEKKRELKQKVKQQMSKEKDSKVPVSIFKGIRPLRSSDNLSIEEKLGNKVNFELKRTANQYSGASGFKPLTEIFSALNPDELFKVVCFACEVELKEYSVSDKQYTIKATIMRDEGRSSMKIAVTKVDDDLSCVEFHRTGNSGWAFYQVVEGLKKRITSELAEYENIPVEESPKEDKN